jgi:hypothetical protein
MEDLVGLCLKFIACNLLDIGLSEPSDLVLLPPNIMQQLAAVGNPQVEIST